MAHLGTIAWWGFAAIFLAYARGAGGAVVLSIAGWTFAATAVVTAAVSRGRHLAWVVFAALSFRASL